MPRRIPDYPDAFMWWNVVASIGSCVSVVSALLFALVLISALRHGPAVGRAPWSFAPASDGPMVTASSGTLEWLLASPPAYHSYCELPVVKYTR